MYRDAGNLAEASNNRSLSLNRSGEDNVIPLPKFTFLVPRSKLLTPEQIQIELRKNEGLFRIFGGDPNQLLLQPSTEVNIAPKPRQEVDFEQFNVHIEAREG